MKPKEKGVFQEERSPSLSLQCIDLITFAGVPLAVAVEVDSRLGDTGPTDAAGRLTGEPPAGRK